MRLLRMLLAPRSGFSADETHAVLTAQARGSFFAREPMRRYGGSPVSFAACFGLKQALQAMVVHCAIDLNDDALISEISGLRPLHSVAAAGKVRESTCTAARRRDAATCPLPLCARRQLPRGGTTPPLGLSSADAALPHRRRVRR